MSGQDKTEELRQKKSEARQSGGPERIAARSRKGSGSARDRVLRLLDADTFVELDVFTEGAVTGHGKVDGRDIYVFSHDGEVPPSALGDAFTRKLIKVIDLAMTNGAPLVGIHDWGLASLPAKMSEDEEAASLGGQAGVYLRNVMASGLVPQIAAIVGPVTGPAVFSPVLADLVVMVKGASQLSLVAPAVGGKAGLEELGGARTLSERSGVAHLAADDEDSCLDIVRVLLSYLPQNNLEETPLAGDADPVDRMDDELESLAAGSSGSAADVGDIIARVFDSGSFLELMPGWAENLVIGVARLGGRAVGLVANQPARLEGRLDADACAKGARFVRFCDAFNVPLVTLVDTPGFGVVEAQAAGQTLREAAKLMYAYCEATVPKLTVVTGRAWGEGFELMCSKHIGADFNFAWPGAEIRRAANVGAAGGPASDVYQAARAGHLDDVIEPVTTRPRLVAALEACVSKRENRPPKKHGNIPL